MWIIKEKIGNKTIFSLFLYVLESISFVNPVIFVKHTLSNRKEQLKRDTSASHLTAKHCIKNK